MPPLISTPAFLISHVGQAIQMSYFPRHFIVRSDYGHRSVGILLIGVARLSSGLLSSDKLTYLVYQGQI